MYITNLNKTQQIPDSFMRRKTLSCQQRFSQNQKDLQYSSEFKKLMNQVFHKIYPKNFFETGRFQNGKKIQVEGNRVNIGGIILNQQNKSRGERYNKLEYDSLNESGIKSSNKKKDEIDEIIENNDNLTCIDAKYGQIRLEGKGKYKKFNDSLLLKQQKSNKSKSIMNTKGIRNSKAVYINNTNLITNKTTIAFVRNKQQKKIIQNHKLRSLSSDNINQNQSSVCKLFNKSFLRTKYSNVNTGTMGNNTTLIDKNNSLSSIPIHDRSQKLKKESTTTTKNNYNNLLFGESFKKKIIFHTSKIYIQEEGYFKMLNLFKDSQQSIQQQGYSQILKCNKIKKINLKKQSWNQKILQKEKLLRQKEKQKQKIEKEKKLLHNTIDSKESNLNNIKKTYHMKDSFQPWLTQENQLIADEECFNQKRNF